MVPKPKHVVLLAQLNQVIGLVSPTDDITRVFFVRLLFISQQDCTDAGKSTGTSYVNSVTSSCLLSFFC